MTPHVLREIATRCDADNIVAVILGRVLLVIMLLWDPLRFLSRDALLGIERKDSGARRRAGSQIVDPVPNTETTSE
jgi:hypothetical protein